MSMTYQDVASNGIQVFIPYNAGQRYTDWHCYACKCKTVDGIADLYWLSHFDRIVIKYFADNGDIVNPVKETYCPDIHDIMAMEKESVSYDMNNLQDALDCLHDDR